MKSTIIKYFASIISIGALNCTLQIIPGSILSTFQSITNFVFSPARIQAPEADDPFLTANFFQAAHNGNQERIEQILEHNPALINRHNDAGSTALILATKWGRARLIQELLAAGAEIDAINNSGCTALIEAAMWGNTEVVDELIAAGAKVNAQCHNGSTALMMAARIGHAHIIRKLIAAGADVNAKTHTGWTALMGIAYSNEENRDIIDTFITAGAQVNAQTDSGWTALMEATKKGNKETVFALLDAGADRTIKNNKGKNAFEIARLKRLHTIKDFLAYHIFIPLSQTQKMRLEECMHAIRSKNITLVREILAIEPIIVRAQTTSGDTLLMWATEMNNKEIVEILIAAGADVNAQSRNKGLTALFFAISEGYTAIAETLCLAGANTDIKESMGGETALMWAAKWNKKNIVKILLDAGADHTLTNYYGENALVLAQKRNWTATVEILQNHIPIEPEEKTLMVKPAARL